MTSDYEVLSLFPVHSPPAPPADLGVRASARTAAEQVAAIEQGKAAAHKEWLDEAGRIVLALAGKNGTAGFITDDVLVAVDDAGLFTHERRAMGGVLTSLAKSGAIRKSGEYRRSPRRRSMVPVWISGDLDQAGHAALANNGEAA